MVADSESTKHPPRPNEEPVKLVTNQKTEADLAKELIAEIETLSGDICQVFDRAAASGLSIQWDGVQPVPPMFKHKLVNIRIVKTYIK